MNYTTGQLRTFLTVAQAGSVSEAAESLAVSQPAVSSALASLRRAFGVALVEREGRGLRLTEAGRTLAAYGRRIFALADEAESEVRAAGSAQAVRVRIAAVTTVAEYVLPQPLRQVCEKHPKLRLSSTSAIAVRSGNGSRLGKRRSPSRVDRLSSAAIVSSAAVQTRSS